MRAMSDADDMHAPGKYLLLLLLLLLHSHILAPPIAKCLCLLASRMVVPWCLLAYSHLAWWCMPMSVSMPCAIIIKLTAKLILNQFFSFLGGRGGSCVLLIITHQTHHIITLSLSLSLSHITQTHSQTHHTSCIHHHHHPCRPAFCLHCTHCMLHAACHVYIHTRTHAPPAMHYA